MSVSRRSSTGKAVLAAFIGFALTSCTVVESNQAGASFAAANGTQKRTNFQGTYSLPRKYLNFTILADNLHFSEATHFKVSPADTPQSIVPDSSSAFRYTLNYSPSRFSNDDLDFEFTDQLLSSVTIATDDQSGLALVNFAKAAAKIARLTQGLGTTPGGGTPGALGSERPHSDPVHEVVQLSFDPTDVHSVSRAQKRLGRYMNLRIYPPPRPVTHSFACNHSVCYRPLTSVTVSFEEPHSGNVTDFVVKVPDPHQIEGIDLERSAFVKRNTVLTFAGGSLQKVDMSKPSEIAAAALLPIQVIDAVLTGTGEAIQGLLGVKKSELQGSVDLLNAQAEYLKALASYRQVVLETTGSDVDPFSPAIASSPAAGPLTDDGKQACEDGDCPVFTTDDG